MTIFIPIPLVGVLDAKDVALSGAFTPVYLLSFVVTAIVGYFALNFLKKVLSGGKFWYFGVYLLILGLVSFFLV